MTILVGVVLLLAVWVEASNSQTTPQLKFDKNIVLDQGPIGRLEIGVDQEPADAVFAFARQHGLDSTQQHRVLDGICESLTCTRRKALLWSVPVDINSEAIQQFDLYEGVEPADAVHQFIVHHDLPETFHEVIMSRACAAVECKRLEPGTISGFTACLLVKLLTSFIFN